MKYILSESAESHMAIHWSDSLLPGSTFSSNFCNSLEELNDKLESLLPFDIVFALEGRIGHVYFFENNQIVGNEGVGRLSDYSISDVQVLKRRDQIVNFIELDSLPETSYLTVICFLNSDGCYELVTAFPGKYAPPFPVLGEVGTESYLFWLEHVLLRKRG